MARQEVDDAKAAAATADAASAKIDYTWHTSEDAGGTIYSKALGHEVRYSTDSERLILEQSNELHDVVEHNDARLNRKRSWFHR